MNKLPPELIYTIVNYLDSPKDISTCSQVCHLFASVCHDDRLWKQLCKRLYNIQPAPESLKGTYYEFFTKVLVPYGRYLGFWKSNQKHVGGLIETKFNFLNGTIEAEKILITSLSPYPFHFLFNDQIEEENSLSNLIYQRTKLFTIDPSTSTIFCHECQMHHDELQWKRTFRSNETFFGLSHNALPIEDRSSLISRDEIETENTTSNDVYFIKSCSTGSQILYRPLIVPQIRKDGNDHPLTRFNGIWVGSYGGHGMEILHLEYSREFICPVTTDGIATEPETVQDVLVARKISGDPNVPHGKVSFATVRRIESSTDSDQCYDGVGQIARTNYVEPQFIRTRVNLVNENLLKVTWFALHHTSSFRRCSF